MANHGFVKTKGKLSAERVHKDILEIVRRRFRDVLQVVGPEKWGDGVHTWQLSVPHAGVHWSFQIWLRASGRTLEFRHPVGEWLWWAQAIVMEEELAAKYNGTISDEGVSERWKGDPTKYPTFRSWLRSKYSLKHYKHVEGERRQELKDALKKLYDLEWSHLPEQLRALG